MCYKIGVCVAENGKLYLKFIRTQMAIQEIPINCFLLESYNRLIYSLIVKFGNDIRYL